MSTPRENIGTFANNLSDLVAGYDATTMERDEARTELVLANGHIMDLEAQLAKPPAIVSPSGIPVPTVNSPGFRLTYVEGFDREAPLGSFPGLQYPRIGVYGKPYTSGDYFDTSRDPSYGRPAGQWGLYSAPRTCSVSSSVLRIRPHTEGLRPMVCNILPLATMPVYPALWTGQLYGKFEVVARFRNVLPGYKVAWLLWPMVGSNTTGAANGIGGNGEIDFPERNLSSLDAVTGYMHWQNGTKGSDQYQSTMACDMRLWHKYTIEWTPGACAFSVDDFIFGRFTDRVPNTPMRWGLQTETTLTTLAPPVDSQGDIEIDWLAMSEYTG